MIVGIIIGIGIGVIIGITYMCLAIVAKDNEEE